MTIMEGYLLLMVFLIYWIYVYAALNYGMGSNYTQGNAYMNKTDEEKKEREKLLEDEENLRTGAEFNITDKEKDVNKIFMNLKEKELDRGFSHEDQNPAALHFFKAKSLIEKGDVFPFLKKMPKGALLHVHDSASVSSKWVIKNLTYMTGMLRCSSSKGDVFTFRKLKQKHGCSYYYKVSEERNWSRKYDEKLEKSINLRAAYPEMVFPNLGDIWTRFQGMFSTFNDAFAYVHAFRRYIWQMLAELYSDNVMYAEVRSTLPELYDQNGKIYPKEFTVREYININKNFVKKYGDFLGIKIIYCGLRHDLNTIKTSIKEFKQLHKNFPDFIIGFDLVGQEDKGKTLFSVLNELNDLPKSAKLFFHGGETNWFGSVMDTNLLDAILLKTKRIGHGYALAKHPILMEKVINKEIALEGVTYDFYYAIMSLAPNDAGIRLLKGLVWNSLNYSVLTYGEKQRGLNILDRRWNSFLIAAHFRSRKKSNKNREKNKRKSQSGK
ncbi:adenosine deaminase 2 isoform X3 [Drosophila ananassae]|uniref:adenosine deaminase 2 isoform X3 n=1 Tax=Drosophila ananassae TaxID=7217 RepID=UPI001CFF81A6|nr:adenosine deaminase 2 isoform X3 [Drosophila ananassae]